MPLFAALGKRTHYFSALFCVRERCYALLEVVYVVVDQVMTKWAGVLDVLLFRKLKELVLGCLQIGVGAEKEGGGPMIHAPERSRIRNSRNPPPLRLLSNDATVRECIC